MGRRRRGLLSRGSASKPTKASGTEEASTEAAETPASSEAVPSEAVPAPETEPTEPMAPLAETAAPEPASEDGDTYADDPTVDETVESSYVETGTMGEDTTDDGWGSSVWSKEGDGDPPAQEAAADAAPDEGERAISYSQSTPDLPEAHEQTYPSPTGAPPISDDGEGRQASDYTAPTLQDAPIAQGLYGEYSEFDGGPPPTEEVPSSVMEDVGSAYNAPMNVPEPPPIPGILDRFTPPPVARSGYSQPDAAGSNKNTGLPDYLSGVDDGSSSDEDDLPVPPGRRKKEQELAASQKVKRREYDDDDDEGRGGPPLVVILGGLAVVGVALVGLLGLAWVVLIGMSSSETAEGPTKASPLEVRQDMQREPGLIGVEPKPEPQPEPDLPEPAPEPVPDAPEPAPSAQPATAPRPAPGPRPQPKPVPVAAPKPAATFGTLKVDANRRVIIRVNGQPKGFTPQRLELPPGTYEVSAAMPGQADTEKKKTVTISAPGTTVGVDFAF